MHPMISRHYIKRVSPLPTEQSQSIPIQPYKTIRQEAEEFKAKMRAMRLHNKTIQDQATKAKKGSKKGHAKPLHPRESRLHREPSRFTSVLKEGWDYRVELMKYHFARLKRNLLPTLFCLRVEIEDQQ